MKKVVFTVAVTCFALLGLPKMAHSLEPLDNTLANLKDHVEPGSVAGLGVLFPQRAYTGVDNDAYVVPVLVLESHQFFINGTLFGYYFSDKDEAVRFAVIGTPHFGGYHSSDSSALSGMDDRDWGLDGGVRMTWRNDLFVLKADALTDVSDTANGQELGLTLSRRFWKGFLTPRLGVKWQSEELVDYYYGVRPHEVQAGRREYEPNSTVEYSLGFNIAVPLGMSLALTGDINASFLGDQVRNSPIVDESTLMRYVLGVVYRF